MYDQIGVPLECWKAVDFTYQRTLKNVGFLSLLPEAIARQRETLF